MKSNFRIVVISFAFCLIVNISQSQQLNPDVFSVSNSYTFKGNSELDINNILIKSTFLKKTLNKGKAFLRLGINYNFSGINYESNVLSLNPNNINNPVFKGCLIRCSTILL